MTYYVIFGAVKKFDRDQDFGWMDNLRFHLDDERHDYDTPREGQIRLLLGANPYEADTVCVGRVVAKIDPKSPPSLQELNTSTHRDREILELIRNFAKEKADEFSDLGVFLFSVFD